MACKCSPTVVTTSQKDCEGCLKLSSLRYSCTDGPSPCGDTLIVDLSEYNDLSACDCGTPVYSIKFFDVDAFSSVSVTSNGVLTATTNSDFVKLKEHLITYKVDCPCSILSGTANIYVCKFDECVGVDCDPGQICDQCDGTCVDASSDLDISDGNVGAGTAQGTGFGN